MMLKPMMIAPLTLATTTMPAKATTTPKARAPSRAYVRWVALPVVFVDRVRAYYDILARQEKPLQPRLHAIAPLATP